MEHTWILGIVMAVFLAPEIFGLLRWVFTGHFYDRGYPKRVMELDEHGREVRRPR